MLGSAAFMVVSHFNFEIADAVLGSQTLTNSVQGITNAATQAQQSLTGVGVSFLSGLGLLPVSIMGAIGYAVKASESFEQSALSWANVLSASQVTRFGESMPLMDNLKTAKGMMEEIYETSLQFGINSKELEEFSKQYYTILEPANMQHMATDFARNLLKSAPNLGYEASNAESQLMRMFEGGASSGDPFFRRLAMETPAMAQFAGPGGSKAFNVLPKPDRIMAVSKALEHFAKDTDITTARVYTLTNQLENLRTIMVSSYSILRPVGDALRTILVEALVRLNANLNGPLRLAFRDLGKIMTLLAPNLDAVVLRVLHMQKATQSLANVKSNMVTFGMIKGLWEVLHFAYAKSTTIQALVPRVAVGVGVAAVKAPVTIAGGVIALVVGAVKLFVKHFGLIATVGRFFLNTLVWPLLILSLFEDLAARARGMAQLADLKSIPLLMPKFTAIGLRITNALSSIFGPINDLLNLMASSMSFLFEGGFWLQMAIGPLEMLANVMDRVGLEAIYFYSMLEAVGVGLAWVAQQVMDGNFKNITAENTMKVMRDSYQASREVMVAAMAKGQLTVQQNTKIDKVVIENKFKENMEPDRIAFTIKDQLQRLSNNPTSGRGAAMFPSGGM